MALTKVYNRMIVGTSVNVKDHGAIGDGTTDDTAALIAAVNSLTDGDVLTFPSATYRMNTASAKGLHFNGKSNIKIEGNNSTIKVLDSEPVVLDGAIMWFTDCQDIVVNNLIFDGNRSTRTPSVTTAHNLQIYTTCARLEFNNCRSLNSVTDGINLQSTNPNVFADIPTDIVFNNCEVDNAYRNGVSVIDSLRFRYIGGSCHGTTGTNPQAGMDLEDATGSSKGNVQSLIQGVSFYDNVGSGLQVGGNDGATDLVVTNCEFKNNTANAINVGFVTGCLLADLNILDHTGAVTRGVIDFGAGSSTDITINNIAMKHINPTGTNYGLYMHNVNGPVFIDGFSIVDFNCTGIYVASDGCILSDLRFKDGTAEESIEVAGPNISIFNMNQTDMAKGVVVHATATNFYMNGFYSVDNSLHHFTGDVADIVLLNAKVRQTVSIPASTYAFKLNYSPKLMANCYASSAGTDYTGANAFYFTTGLSDGVILEALTPGFYTGSSVGADVGDAAATLTMGLSEQTQIWDTALTTTRTVTLSATDAKNGDSFRIVRTANSTGASNLTVASTPSKNLATGEYALVAHNGTSWILVESGSL